jgi:signal recognition particle subunit SRP54
MFDRFSQKLQKVIQSLRQRGALTEQDVEMALREIRMALLEADVALSVVKTLVEEIRSAAVGAQIVKSINPAQMVVKLVHDHLVSVLGEMPSPLQFQGSQPSVIMMVGLQGGGKTTTSVKLANFIQKNERKKPLLVSLDVYRPAAQKQLEILAQSHSLLSLPIIENEKPSEIIKRALEWASSHLAEVIILDTAGRLHIDVPMMAELKIIQNQTRPREVLLVADAMTGQDAVRTAQAFHQELSLSGIILTRVDGDGRGGAALSMRQVTQCPIKFLGVGEKIHQLEIFDPERIANRILDMGDVVALVEKAQSLMEEEESEKATAKMLKGQFNLKDFETLMSRVEKSGGASQFLSMLPGFQSVQSQVDPQQVEKTIRHDLAIIRSMTEEERKNPKILNGSRRKRIAKGSGVDVMTVNRLIKKFDSSLQIMRKLRQMGPQNLLRSGLSKLF